MLSLPSFFNISSLFDGILLGITVEPDAGSLPGVQYQFTHQDEIFYFFILVCTKQGSRCNSTKSAKLYISYTFYLKVSVFLGNKLHGFFTNYYSNPIHQLSPSLLLLTSPHAQLLSALQSGVCFEQVVNGLVAINPLPESPFPSYCSVLLTLLLWLLSRQLFHLGIVFPFP